MDFQFCQPKFGALPVLQDYPSTFQPSTRTSSSRLAIMKNSQISVRRSSAEEEAKLAAAKVKLQNYVVSNFDRISDIV